MGQNHQAPKGMVLNISSFVAPFGATIIFWPFWRCFPMKIPIHPYEFLWISTFSIISPRISIEIYHDIPKLSKSLRLAGWRLPADRQGGHQSWHRLFCADARGKQCLTAGLFGWENGLESPGKPWNSWENLGKTTEFTGKPRGNHNLDHQIIGVFQVFSAGYFISLKLSLGMEHW